MTTLMNERTTIGGAGGGGRTQRRVGVDPGGDRHLEASAPTTTRSTATGSMQLWIETEVLRLTNMRAPRRRRAPATRARKVRSPSSRSPTSTRRRTSCASTSLGADGIVGYDYTFTRPNEAGLDAPLGSSRKMFLRARANSIEGGTSEIMRNILGERILGLPGEPRVDRDLPWSQVPRS